MLRDADDKREVEERRVEPELIKETQGIYHTSCSLRVQREGKNMKLREYKARGGHKGVC